MGPRLAASLAIALAASVASAQCPTNWAAGVASAGTNGYVRALATWDPDGPGPATSVWVVAGNFSLAGGQPANSLATFDPSTGQWSPLGSRLFYGGQSIRAIAALANGNLIVGGNFTNSGFGCIALWNGSQWLNIGDFTNSTSLPEVDDLVVLPNGNVVAVGAFDAIGGVAASRMARWDGVTWTEFGGGANQWVKSLSLAANGDLLALGAFTAIGGIGANGIARWNGATWAPLGAGFPAGQLEDVLALSSGDVVVTGYFFSAGGVPARHIARWNGVAWSALGGGLGGLGWCLSEAVNGDVLVGGDFTSAGAAACQHVARWNGSTFAPLGAGLSDAAYALLSVPGGGAVAGGYFLDSGGATLHGLGIWNGAQWQPTSVGGLDNAVLVVRPLAAGGVVLGGDFDPIHGTSSRRVASWRDGVWSGYGSGFDGSVWDIVELPGGELLAGGTFTTADGVAAMRIARWNGTSWQPLGAGMDAFVAALAVLPNGDLLAAGGMSQAGGTPVNYVARWDGTAWHAFGTGLLLPVMDLSVLQDGSVVAIVSSGFTGTSYIEGRIVRWSGTAWIDLGGTLGPAATGVAASAITVAPNGDLIACGGFTSIGGVPLSRVARWDGANWSALGSGADRFVSGLACLPNGDLIATGSFTVAGGQPALGVARWDGVGWSAFGAGLGGGDGKSLGLSLDGTVAIGGTFVSAGGNVSPFFARMRTACPATATSSGSPCATTAGMMQLEVTQGAWLGVEARTRCPGIVTGALALGVLGLSPIQVPLASLLPVGQPGCLLTTAPMAFAVLAPVAGEVSWSVPIPVMPVLIGTTFREQIVELEFNPGPQASAMVASNSLALTIGRL